MVGRHNHDAWPVCGAWARRKRPRPSLCVREVQYFTGELWLATSGSIADVWRDDDRMDSRALV
jgi:hypothetical protein